MEIGVVALFPQAVQTFCDIGVIGRAQEQGAVGLRFWDIRDFAQDRRKTVDDRPYGGGPGMVLTAPPMVAAISAARAAQPDVPVIFMSPAGRTLNHAGVMALATRPGFILVAGRYEGLDERVIHAEIDEEWSVGDFVLSGGEIAAAIVIDAVVRQLPGVLGHEDSAREDSFVEGLLDYPHYTRPEEWQGRLVPEVLLSGDHARIRRWRLKEALGRTWLRRPELLSGRELSTEEACLLEEFKQECRGHDS